MATCAHCGALLTSPICAICGKSVQDEVEVVEVAPERRSMSTDSRRQLLRFGGFVAGVALLGGIGYVLLTGEDAEPAPTMLATPDPVESTTTVARPTVDPPTIARSVAPTDPLPTLPVSTETEVVAGDGANPWAGAPPRNVLTGELLDNTDYGPGLAAIADLLASAPAAFTFTGMGEAEANGVNLAAAETAQPFAARRVADETGPITDVWLFARGASTTDGAAAYLEQARARWPIDEPLDSYSPRAGVRLHLVRDDGTRAIWVDSRDSWLLVYRATTGIDPALLGAISDGWG